MSPKHFGIPQLFYLYEILDLNVISSVRFYARMDFTNLYVMRSIDKKKYEIFWTWIMDWFPQILLEFLQLIYLSEKVSMGSTFINLVRFYASMDFMSLSVMRSIKKRNMRFWARTLVPSGFPQNLLGFPNSFTDLPVSHFAVAWHVKLMLKARIAVLIPNNPFEIGCKYSM